MSSEPTSTIAVRARSYELDPYGHVNNAVIVNWLEHGRSSYLGERGMSWQSLPDQFGVRVVVVHQAVTYQAEIRLDDALIVTSRITSFGRTSFTFTQEVGLPDGRTAARAEVVMVSVLPDGPPEPIPADLQRLLAGPTIRP